MNIIPLFKIQMPDNPVSGSLEHSFKGLFKILVIATY